MSDTRARLIDDLVREYKLARVRADELRQEVDILETALAPKKEEATEAEDLRDDLARAIDELGGDLDELLK